MAKATKAENTASAIGQCLCGAVQIEIGVPARWAWHDHSSASRRAHGAAYATYVGCWRSRFRVTKGKAKITRFQDKATGRARSFCSSCGTPLIAGAPWQVQVCKLADIFDNLMDSTHVTAPQRARALENARRYLAALRSQLTEPASAPWQIVAGLCEEIAAHA